MDEVYLILSCLDASIRRSIKNLPSHYNFGVIENRIRYSIMLDNQKADGTVIKIMSVVRMCGVASIFSRGVCTVRSITSARDLTA